MTPGRKPSITTSAFADQRKRDVATSFGVLQVQRRHAGDRGQVTSNLEPHAPALAVDPHHVRAHVGQQHAGEGAGANPGKFNHFHA
jgi:hypothetical protein